MPEGLRVAGFCLPFRPFDGPEHMVQDIMARSAGFGEGAGSFLVFPGMYAMGLLPTAFRMEPVGMFERLRAAGTSLEKAYHDAGSEAAKRLHAWLLPGSVLIPARPGYRHVAAIFDPEGRVIGEQAQTHAFGDEVELAVATSVATFPVGDLHVGILLGADPWAPAVSRVLALEGADLLVAPLAPRRPYTAERAVAGLWQEAQQNQVFGLETGLTGELFETEADGRLAFFGPCETTPEESGFIGEAGYVSGETARAHHLDRGLLRQAREAFPIFRHLNPSLYRRYLPERRRNALP